MVYQAGALTFAFSVTSLVICLSNFLFSWVEGRMGKLQNKLFALLLFIVAVNSVCNIVIGIYEPYMTMADDPAVREHAIAMCSAFRYVYFLFHTLLAPMFLFYIANVCGYILSSSINRYIYHAIIILSEILAASNPLTGFLYSLDREAGVFRRSWGTMVLYVVAAFFFFSAMIYLFSSWKALTAKRRTGMFLFSALSLSGIVVQLLFPTLKIELFAEAIGLTGVMMIIENEDDRIEGDSGIYNRRAFLLDAETYICNKISFNAVCLRVNTPEIISSRSGADNKEILEKSISAFLCSVHNPYDIYKIGRRTYVLTLFKDADSKSSEVAHSILERFERPWQLSDTFVMLSASILIAKIPEQIDSSYDMLYMFDNFKQGDKEKKIMSGDDLNKLIKASVIGEAISRGLAEGRFEVYYQPTFSIDGRKLHGAEALVRLNDEKMGLLFPDEFIPAAENLGLIDAIDDFVLMDVCRTIVEEDFKKRGIDCINVNLSVIQLMKPGFVEHINGIVEASGADKRMINFEVTESVSADGYNILNSVINDLKKEGFLFSMDDYGTGYSNMSALASMNIDCIKIDKSILWEAEKSELGGIILENAIRMIHQLGRDILVEGVETEDQIKLLEPLGVNYLQGYFFSKPVPKAKFLEIVHDLGI